MENEKSYWSIKVDFAVIAEPDIEDKIIDELQQELKNTFNSWKSKLRLTQSSAKITDVKWEN